MDDGRKPFVVLVNKDVIAENATLPRSEWRPPLSVLRDGSQDAEQGFEALISGVARLRYSPVKRMPYGRGVWIEGEGAVVMNKEVPHEDQDSPADGRPGNG